jgi:hypothetical protein
VSGKNCTPVVLVDTIWAARPELTNVQVADVIEQSARRSAAGWTPMGWGVLDAGAALKLALTLR